MNTAQKIGKNIGFFIFAQGLGYILDFFFFMYTARYFGAEGFGILSFALALMLMFGVLTDLGLRQLTVREVARESSLREKYLRNIIGIKAILVIPAFILLALFVNIWNYPETTIKIVYLIALAGIFRTFSEAFYALFQAHEKMEYESLGRVLNSALLLVSVLFVMSQGFGLFVLAIFYSLAAALTFGYNLIISTWKFIRPKIEIDLSFWKSASKEALPFALIGVFGMIYHWIDTVMLSLMKGDAVVGWYNAAYRIFLVSLFIPSACNVSIFPVMSRFYISSKQSLKFIHEKYFKYITILGFPIGISVTLIADKIILLALGPEYQPSIIALRILIWSAVLIFISSSYARLLESTNKQIIITKIMGVATVFNVLSNLIVIPKYGYIGASATTVISELIVTVAVIIMVVKIGYKIPNLVIINLLWRVSLSSLIMVFFIIFLRNINLFLLIIFSSIIYFGTIYLTRGFDKEDLTLLNQIISPPLKRK